MDLYVGQSLELTRVFTQEQFDIFAEITGDNNPIHVDPVFAAATRFEKTLCHGMLLFSTLAAAMGSHLPGPGSVILKQQLKFPGPTYAGDEVRVRLEVLEWDATLGQVELSTVISRTENDSISCEGRALVRVADVDQGGHHESV